MSREVSINSFALFPISASISTTERARFIVAVKKIQNSVSSQCASGKSSIARKPEVHPKLFFNGKKLLKNCNSPDFKFYPSKLNNTDFPLMVQC